MREACVAHPELQWVYPAIAHDIVRGAAILEDLVGVLASRDGLAVYNACEVIRVRGWVDDCAEILIEIVRTSRDGDACLGAMNALRSAHSKAVHDAMLRLACDTWTRRWPRGRVIEAIARNVRPSARRVLSTTFAAASVDSYERLAAAAGLARLGDADALAYVETNARTAGPHDRWLAREMLTVARGSARRSTPPLFRTRPIRRG